MAKITITSNASTVTINYNDYAGIIGISSEKMNRANIALALSADSSYVEFQMTKWGLWLSHDGHGATRQVDSVNGEAPTDTADLFDKLATLIG